MLFTEDLQRQKTKANQVSSVFYIQSKNCKFIVIYFPFATNLNHTKSARQRFHQHHHMRKYLLITILFFYSVYSFAQHSDGDRKIAVDEMLFNGPHFSFSIIPYVVQKARITKQSGNYNITSSNMEGIEAGGNYHINFEKDLSLIIGLHGGASARNHKLFIDKDEYTPPLNFDVDDNGAITRIFDFYISAPVWLEKRWPCKNDNHWNVLAGINIRYYPIDQSDGSSYLESDINGQTVDVFDLDVSIGNKKRPWINYNIGGGYSLLLHNNNFLRFNLLANFSTTKMVNGSYTINVTGKEPSTGNYSANLSYIGLAVSYILTGTNKRLKRLDKRK